MMQRKICANCKNEQYWDALFGFANQLCPEFCKVPKNIAERFENIFDDSPKKTVNLTENSLLV